MDSILVNMFVLLTEFLIFLEIEQDLGGERGQRKREGERERIMQGILLNICFYFSLN